MIEKSTAWNSTAGGLKKERVERVGRQHYFVSCGSENYNAALAGNPNPFGAGQKKQGFCLRDNSL
jgi:hypothetical protein